MAAAEIAVNDGEEDDDANEELCVMATVMDEQSLHFCSCCNDASRCEFAEVASRS